MGKYTQPLGAAAGAGYVDAAPSAGIEGSAVPAAAIEWPQRELDHLISYAGLVPAAGDLTQVRQAVAGLIGARAATADQARAMALTTVFLTPLGLSDAFSGARASLGPTGYLMLPAANGQAGLTFQWGTGYAGSAGPVVTFPRAWTIGCWGLFAGDIGTAPYAQSFSDITLSSFRWWSSLSSDNAFWLALGR